MLVIVAVRVGVRVAGGVPGVKVDVTVRVRVRVKVELGPPVGVNVRVDVRVKVELGPLVGVNVRVDVRVKVELGPLVRLGVFDAPGPEEPMGVGATEQPKLFCQFCTLIETVLALLAVMLMYMAPVESLPTVKLFNWAPLPLKVALWLAQLVTVSLVPPYHWRALLTVESEPFITVHMAPFLNDVFTYL